MESAGMIDSSRWSRVQRLNIEHWILNTNQFEYGAGSHHDLEVLWQSNIDRVMIVVTPFRNRGQKFNHKILTKKSYVYSHDRKRLLIYCAKPCDIHYQKPSWMTEPSPEAPFRLHNPLGWALCREVLQKRLLFMPHDYQLTLKPSTESISSPSLQLV